jgi:hypothetical protein
MRPTGLMMPAGVDETYELMMLAGLMRPMGLMKHVS